MAKLTRQQGKKGVTKSTLSLLTVSIVLFCMLLVVEIPNGVTRAQFFSVLHAISTDPRYNKPIPYAYPPLENQNFTGYGRYYWWHDGAVDWEEIQDYVTDMVGGLEGDRVTYLNNNASWCEYYSYDSRPWLTFHWLIWYEQLPGSYSFLFLHPDDSYPVIPWAILYFYPVIITALVITIIVLSTQIGQLLYNRKTPTTNTRNE